MGRTLHRDLVDFSLVPDAKVLDVDTWQPHRKATGKELRPLVRAATVDIVEFILTILMLSSLPVSVFLDTSIKS